MRVRESVPGASSAGTIEEPDRRSPVARLVGDPARAGVQRAIAELLAGRPVAISDAGDASASDGAAGSVRVVLPADALAPGSLADLRALASRAPTLLVSPTRAAAWGETGGHAMEVALPDGMTPAQVIALAIGPDARLPAPPSPAGPSGDAAVELAKLATLLPALVGVRLRAEALPGGLLQVDAGDVRAFRAGQAASLRRVSSAPVPLRDAPDCEFTVFRDELGQSWSMIRVGRPDPGAPVPVRLHSACLTGDAFGSLRCDCGDQLRMALSAIHALGGGVLLYLAQEGCGIGLGNKMRAYRLQEQGLDTVDANTALGFEMDERRYDTAARMLRAAGIDRVSVLTNNPAKLDALRDAGIEVCGRIPLVAPVGGGNRRYLETKRRRAGHLIGEASPLAAG